MKRSAKDYLVYILTMTVVSALMYAFNSLIFQNELTGKMEDDAIMPIMIGLATLFIVLIMAWLIHYMVRFMMEKRGSEFGIYMLLGMKKKTIFPPCRYMHSHRSKKDCKASTVLPQKPLWSFWPMTN